MAAPCKIVRYANEIAAILVPLGGMTYFRFAPEAFNSFLAWLISL
jgi:hypothetical protein